MNNNENTCTLCPNLPEGEDCAACEIQKDNALRTEHNANHDGHNAECMYCARHMERLDRQIKAAGREATYIRKVIRALKANGTPIVSVWDGEESTPVKTERDILECVYNLDECHLYTDSGDWVYVVLGNEWDEVVNDYTVSIEPAMETVEDWAAAQQY